MTRSNLPSRAGFALGVVAFLILIATAGVLLLQRLRRDRFRRAHQHLHARIAESLAESAIQAVFEEIHEAQASLESFFSKVLIEAPARDLEGFSRELEVLALSDLVDLYQGDAQVEVWLTVSKVRPWLKPPGRYGMRPDPREKRGELGLEARAWYRGTQRKMRVQREFVVRSGVIPVFSKFTLALFEQGPSPWNRIQNSRVDPDQTGDEDGPARPLVLFHHGEVLPTVSDQRFHALAPLFSDQAADRGGLVYLGGSRSWDLPLAHGSGAGLGDELFHLRRARTRIPKPRPGVTHEIGMTFGFYQGVLDEPPLRPTPASPRPRDATGTPFSDQVSGLRLFGDVDNVSPTVVLGPVQRLYLRLKVLDGLWYPYLTREDYQSKPRPAPVDRGYRDYQEVMAQVVREPYNRGQDFLRSNHEEVDAEGRVHSPEETPWIPELLLPEALTVLEPRSAGDLGFLYPDPQGDPAGASIRLLRQGTGAEPQPLFEGNLEEFRGDALVEVLRSRVVESYPSQAEFLARCVRNGVLEAPAVVEIQKGGLELGDLAFRTSSTILVEGPVQLRGWLRRARAGACLSLASLDQDILVETEEELVVQLLAPKGRVRFPLDQVFVRGGIVASHLDARELVRGRAPKWLVYDEARDPTLESTARRHLRLHLAPRYGIETVAGSEEAP